jgi:hypothetical protein
MNVFWDAAPYSLEVYQRFADAYCLHHQDDRSSPRYYYRVPTRQMREFSTFSVISALRHSPSARCASAANDI